MICLHGSDRSAIKAITGFIKTEPTYTEQEFAALDPSVFTDGKQDIKNAGMAKIAQIMERLETMYTGMTHDVKGEMLYILARQTVFDIGFYDDLAVMCLPFDETPEITPELADYLLTLSFEVGFGYLATREGELSYCSEFGTKGINLMNFDSILRGMLDGVAYLREDEVLGPYVPEPLTPSTDQ